MLIKCIVIWKTLWKISRNLVFYHQHPFITRPVCILFSNDKFKRCVNPDQVTFQHKATRNFHSKINISSDTAEARRIDILISTDETVRKWNEFYVFFKEVTGVSCSKTMKEILICLSDFKEDEKFLLAFDKWVLGHINKSYDILLELYKRGDIDKQQQILIALQCLIFHSLSTKGKALCKIVIEGASKFAEGSDEICVLVTVWYTLFTSEWYEDRCAADQILHNSTQLQRSLDKLFPLIGYYMLKSRNIPNYQRLIEISLHFNLENSTILLLRALFNYYYKMGYIKGCDVIFKCCTDINVKLSADQILKYNSIKKKNKNINQYFQIHISKGFKYKF